ncbi:MULTISPECIES: ribosome assembly RNA-binding protein YhbY [Limosilactobacillus]|jgi:putative RNA-binding protein, yhbY family|uniref:Ribosome assembly RNA-binding protein YhbY n=1 Tax=Limosilactobacillus portuensis TaxID=2742601 RepID=A0ABS6IZ87_9LACO|nr:MULTISPECIES: ribosome assembly RNA-binding protein YhbY [Limosilactobacillus]MDU1505708.1 ribosome assembly RNA-binding protein YhbY [Limosilactobacillus vaginalis]PMC27237.1 ribosome assembly RNA-binding protein YhbY [Gardnerella vaginalis]MBD8087373.1 ribosome assembly RNA-binding protein YhbY [Limosilactobacillus portuensis]MBU9695445.1 ribosome assembly RNA-binding protein YhbY [Limosilactobacillus portuensis]MEC4741713.1 ribosome assembly RNA-binding protein YhbY [Limosilactobacillus 
MELRGKQKRFLRAQANHLQPIFAVGKEGLTQNWVDQLDGALDHRELIKVNILQNSDVTPKDVQHFIESQTEIQVVQIIGRVLVLFKVSANKDARELSSRVKKI